MHPVVNIAAYKFVALEGLPELREELRELTRVQELRGTILLSHEGVNLFVAGSRAGIDILLARLRTIPGVENLEVKESHSQKQPFNRMLVKIKAEIIAFGVEGIDPQRKTSRRVSALQLKQWLDEGRPVTLLDTRNDFEVETGTFKQALAIGIDDFREFPQAVKELPAHLKQQPVVTFCTGGIRCEKAAPYLEREGFEDVYQLDGGILKYFEECGDAHYDGLCFVFDQRVALDAKLQERELKVCFVCQAIVPVMDQRSYKYVAGQSCPACYRSPKETYEELLRRRQTAIRALMSPLPGSAPYENIRPLSVPLRLDGSELLDFLESMRTHFTREDWRQSCLEGRLLLKDEPVLPARIVRSGERFYHKTPAASEPDVAANIEILHEDEAIVVINKPAPLPMHPCGRFNRNSLTYVLEQVYRPLKPRPAHRLDADTSGVVVFSKTREVARDLQPQFEAGEVRKSYVARVHGRPPEATFECHAPIQMEPGPEGVRLPDEAGVPASTLFRVIPEAPDRPDDGTTLLEVQPLTGRTNQIRAHLWTLGFPIVGDPIYRQNQQLGALQTLSISDPPLCLHAAVLEFVHPLTGQRVEFRAPVPGW